MFRKNYSDSYAELQTVRAETKNEVTFWQKLIVGGSSGVLATSLVYPLDVVKTTMQRQVVGKSVLYKNPIQAAKGIVSFNGVSGLYKGIGVNLATTCSAISWQTRTAVFQLFVACWPGLGLAA
ncbi:hypothetical protein AV274_2263 [Blastocystis sp. ATCC 50177/Nand II]|uniref:Uncharacterized protein n=1 Tax=Blastocystis sp. subtype 1 (strain ATCC 50177 / NandII) TaxID=478820 RepID=A0A196SG82_BLAHN|nr:hypothetical protein AV274_2263 [Blastocystis sp. ATCC 50177/Nand II]